jgi:uncharacterized membrane protein YjjP (DUF1212 family)
MRPQQSSDQVERSRFVRATITLVGSLAAVTLVVAASACGVYFLIAIATGSHVVPRSSYDLQLLGSLSLVIGGFAVITAARDELRARRRDENETPELSPASRPS